jgi:hypothetical protein
MAFSFLKEMPILADLKRMTTSNAKIRPGPLPISVGRRSWARHRKLARTGQQAKFVTAALARELGE